MIMDATTPYVVNQINAFTPKGLESVRRVATIGFFDGVHTGHRFLLSQVERLAKERHLAGLAVTFETHPRQVLQSDYRPALLTTPQEKFQRLKVSGIDACALLQFTPEMAQLSAQSFMKSYLQERFGVDLLVMGYDHHFGHERHLSFEDYKRLGEEIGLEVVRAEAFQTDGFTVSSSVVRRLLKEGDVAQANDCLGYAYELSGVIEEGHHVGSKLGFPTANLSPLNQDKLIPERGVYAVEAVHEGKTYAAMLNIGFRPTLNNGNNLTIEAHLFGFSGNLYGENITLRFLRRIRDEKQFSSLDELKVQLHEDALKVQKILKKQESASSRKI